MIIIIKTMLYQVIKYLELFRIKIALNFLVLKELFYHT